MTNTIAAIFIVALLTLTTAVSCQKSFTMKSFYSDPIGEDEWSRRHEIARSNAHTIMIAQGVDAHCQIFQSLDAQNATRIASELIESEQVDLLAFTSGDFAETVLNISAKYPNQKLLTAGARVTANSINITPRAYEGYYLGGRACAMVSNTKKIGYMGLTPTSNTFGIVNAIYAGMKHVDPEAELYVMFTNDFYDPLLESKTADYMVRTWDVDCGISQSVDANAMWANTHEIPVMGFISDMRYQVGENVMFSVTYTWDSFYYDITQQVLNGTFVGNRTISSGFDRIMKLTAFSTTTRNDVAVSITSYMNAIANNSYAMFCGDLTKYVVKRTSNASCLTTAEIRAMNAYYPDILNIRNLTRDDIIERVFVDYDSGLGVAVMVVASFVVVMTVAFIGYVLKNRMIAVITKSAYRFCVLVLVGVVMGAVSTFFWLGYPADALCMARVWLGGIGFTLSYGGLVIKNYRIWRIFKDTSLRTTGTTDSSLVLKGVLPLLAMEITILVLWTAIDPLKVTIIEESPFLAADQIYVACKSESVWPVVVFLVSKGIILIFGVIVSYNTRAMDAAYNESKEIGWSIYNTVLFGFLAVVANLIVSYNALLEVAVVTISIFVICLSVVGFVFIPKFWRITIKGRTELSTRANSSMITTAKSGMTLPTLASNTASNRDNKSSTDNDESSL